MNIEILEAPTEKNSIAVIANMINSGLVAFEERKAKLTEIKNQCDHLTIESLDDKQGIMQVVTYRKKLKSERVEITKEGKSMRDPLTQLSRTICEKENELIAIIEPTEKLLLSKEKWVEQEKERISIELENKEKERIQSRIDRLAQYGFAIDLNFIKGLDDDSFEKVVSNARIEHEKELAKKAEEKCLAEIEAQRLIDERKELQELRKKQEEAQRIIDENNRKIKDEQDQKEAAIRNEQLRIEDEKRKIELAKQKEMEDKKRAAELEIARNEAAEKERQRLIEKAKQDKIDVEEKLNQASDKIKFQHVVTQLKAIAMPEMKSNKSKKILQEVKSSINDLIARIQTV